MNVFDILGPVMIGPSSSHTAGAARIGLVTRALLGKTPVKAHIFLHGSFAKTYKGHGTDKALIAGLLGMEPDNEDLRYSFDIAKEQGMEFEFSAIELENVHPNTTVAIRMKGISGETGSMKLYAYGADGTLKEVPAEKWHIQTEDGETPDTLSEGVLYEVHMTVEDGGDFDLSETEKEIKISAVLGI